MRLACFGGDRAARGDVLLIDLDRRLIPEGGLSHEEFVQKDAKSPPVDGGGVAFRLDDLGGEVLGGATEGVCLFYTSHQGSVSEACSFFLSSTE